MNIDIKFKEVSGIYQIRNKLNGKVYVGRTKCFWKRCQQYRYDFNSENRDRINHHLMNAVSKYGVEQFTFEPIEKCSSLVIEDRELYWMQVKCSTNRDKGYNLRMDAGKSMIAHPETRLKISKRLKKEWSSGQRDGHSQAIKESWVTRDRNSQSKLMTKNLTKYEYRINDCTVSYWTLRQLGLKNVMSKFHVTKKDRVTFKGFNIEKVRL